MKKMRNASHYWSLRTTILLLLLIGVVFWQYQSSSSAVANQWSWEDQLQMELAMANAAEMSPGAVPEIDRSIPKTETALFALG